MKASEIGDSIPNVDEESAWNMWLRAHGWISEDGHQTDKYYNFDSLSREETAELVAYWSGEESRGAAEAYGESHASRRTGPGGLTKSERLHQKVRELILQNPTRTG